MLAYDCLVMILHLFLFSLSIFEGPVPQFKLDNDTSPFNAFAWTSRDEPVVYAIISNSLFARVGGDNVRQESA